MKNKNVIYTAIFGDYDHLETPEFPPEGFDFICFTDNDLQSDFWDVRKVTPLYIDSTRNARKYKILPHRYLQEYEISIWMDGNQLVVGDYNEIIESHLSDKNLACYDHNQCVHDPRDCVYEEASAILWLGRNNNNNFKDDPVLIENQSKKYLSEGYPPHSGLVVSGVMLRRHNEADVKKTMELWWEELKYGSKRDQLSFNYSTWRTNLEFNYLDGDIRDDGYTLEVRHKQ